MGVIGGTFGYSLLRTLGKNGAATRLTGVAYEGTSKLSVLFGSQFWAVVANQVVIDFGCGTGVEAVEMARHGAKRVIGVDIQEHFLREALQRAVHEGVTDRCTFTQVADEPADIIVSVDSFEHFADPAGVLAAMRAMVKPTGRVFASFGPTWYHPLGGHLFSVFPWAHLIFTERALIRWRSDFKTDGATRFCEVAGGLNRMTILRFEQIVKESAFEFARFEAVPIRRLQPLANRFTREFVTAFVRCELLPRHRPAAA